MKQANLIVPQRTLFPTGAFLILGFLGLTWLHVQSVSKLLPMSAAMNDRPLSQYDYGLLLGRTLRDQVFRSDSHRFYGYDPYQMAGAPAGNVWEWECRFSLTILRALKTYFSPICSIKIWTYLALFILPFILYAAALRLGFGAWEALLVLCGSSAGFSTFDLLSSGIIQAGFLDFLFGCYFSVFTVGAFVAAVKKQKLTGMIEAGISLSLLAFIYPPMVLVVVWPCLAVWIFAARNLSRRINISLLLIASVVLVELMMEAQPFSSTEKWVGFIFSSPVTWFDFSDAYLAIFGVADGLSVVIRGLILFCAIKGFIVLCKTDRPLGVAWTAWFLSVVIFLVLGPHFFYFDRIQPRRFLILFSLIQYIPAAAYVSNCIHAKPKIHGVAPLWILLIFGLWTIHKTEGFKPLMLESSENLQGLIPDLKRLTKSGRVLLECDAPSHTLPDAFPFFTGRAYVGIPSPTVRMVSYRETGFFPNSNGRPMLFGFPVRDYTEDRLLGACNYYNIRYVVVLSLSARAKFDQFPASFRPMASSFSIEPDRNGCPNRIVWPGGSQMSKALNPVVRAPYRIYEVVSETGNYLLTGSGDVEADYDRIVIKHPSRGELILKFHWLKTIIAPEGVGIRPFRIKNGLIPFIAVTNDQMRDNILLKNQP